jgi:hypothetical protein
MKANVLYRSLGAAVVLALAGSAAGQCLQWEPDHLGTRSGHALAYDSARGRMVLYGISDLDTWSRGQGSAWSRVATSGPAVFLPWLAMTYDEARGRVVAVEGSFSNGLNQTWEFDGASWSPRAAGPQDTLVEFSMAYDAAHHETILFGGHQYGGNTSLTTWAWNGSVWAARSQAAPGPRFGAAMAFDSARGQLVLFGGGTGGNAVSGETWTWDGAAWTVRSAAGPVPRQQGSMAFDPARGRMVLFGGSDTLTLVAPETWEWDGAAWSRRATGGLAARARAGMAYDPGRGRIVLYGGSRAPSNFSTNWDLGETAEWDGNAWSVSTPTVPAARTNAAVAYDPARGETILFGGGSNPNGLLGDTWRWNGAWTQVNVAGPSARSGAAMAADSARGRLVLFGGWNTGLNANGDTWEWNGAAAGGGAWALRSTTGPSPRGGAAAAFDASRAVTVLYGGYINNTGYSRETWEWDGNTWQRRLDGPPGNERGRMAYDPVRQVCVYASVMLLGGVYHPETWEWDGHGAGTWTARQASGMPDLGIFAMDYDPRVGAVVAAMAPLNGEPSGSTWKWTGTVWEPLEAGAHGTVGGAVFDAARGRFAIVSSEDQQVWELSGAPCPCYANCDGSTAPPALNVLDFNCFLNRFAAAESYANCDGSTAPPVLNVLDFNCFLNRFAAGCP